MFEILLIFCDIFYSNWANDRKQERKVAKAAQNHFMQGSLRPTKQHKTNKTTYLHNFIKTSSKELLKSRTFWIY